MAHSVKTIQLAAYIESRKVRFAGAQVTLKRLAQMWNLPIDLAQDTVAEDVLARIAQYFKLALTELVAVVEQMPLPKAPAPPLAPSKPVPTPVSPPPVRVSTPPTTVATVAPASTPAPPPPTPAPIPTLPLATSTAAPLPAPPGDTAAIPKAQLDDLVAKTRPSEPSLEAAATDADPDIEIGFDDVENTPPPTAADPKPKSRRGKGNKKR